MPSKFEAFWNNRSFAVIGHSQASPFPSLTYQALRDAADKTVYPIDPSTDRIEGDAAFGDLASLPEPVDAVVIEVPKQETAAWVERAAAAGITDVWIHQGRDTAEAVTIAEKKGLNLRTGACAVQYLNGSFPHNVHKFFRKLSGNW